MLLRAIYNRLSQPGIIGPHAGHEAELLLCGVKPIGIVCQVLTDKYVMTQEDYKDLEDIQRLDDAVARGQLKKTIVNIPNPSWTISPLAVHHYCQPKKEKQMQELAQWHNEFWNNGIEGTLSEEDHGVYYGYSKEDIQLWIRGGYASFWTIQGFFQQTTHHLRCHARLESLKYPTLEN